MTAATALQHPYLDEGRLRFHSCMCKCCPSGGDTSSASSTSSLSSTSSSSSSTGGGGGGVGGRKYTLDFDPVCPAPFSYTFEDELCSLTRVKGQLCPLTRALKVIKGKLIKCSLIRGQY